MDREGEKVEVFIITCIFLNLIQFHSLLYPSLTSVLGSCDPAEHKRLIPHVAVPYLEFL